MVLLKYTPIVLTIAIIVILLVVLLPEDAGLKYSSDFSSELPVILLYSPSSTIPSVEDSVVQMDVIYKGDTEYWTGLAEISRHGDSSKRFPQKSISLKSLHVDGSKDKFGFFGFPKGTSWLLVNHYNDRALMRNALTFELFRQMGRYAPRYQHCEVFFNYEYAGVYLFVEKITQGKHRVDIKEMSKGDKHGNDVTGGYIWKFDEDDHWLMQYPSNDNIQKAQSNYLLNEFIPRTFAKLTTSNDTERQKLFEDESLIDYFLISELSANVDGYRKSRYFYKDRDDKDPRVHAGPVWDYDWAWKFISGIPPNYGFNWIYQNTEQSFNQSYMYKALFSNSELFANKTIEQWALYREKVFSEHNLFSLVDNFFNLLNSSGAASRHFAVFNTFGMDIGQETYLPLATNYEEEIANLKAFITFRLDFIDSNITKIHSS